MMNIQTQSGLAKRTLNRPELRNAFNDEVIPELTQAASVLATVKRDGIEAKGGAWSAQDEENFKAPIRQQYEDQGHPYYATARMWDDGIIDPADTRRVLALGLAAAQNAPVPEPKFGIFRM